MNFIKYVALTGIIIFYCSVEAFACHQEINTPILGHRSKYSSNMTTVHTEATSASTSTTSHCDTYTSFIRKGYQFIAEEAAQGQGEHLKVLAQTMGCPAESYPEFAAVLKTQYSTLFAPTPPETPQHFLQQVENVVADRPSLSKACLKS